MARTKKTKSNEEYTPNKEDKKKLLRIFHSMSVDNQHKDLLTTKRVIKKGNKKQLDEWKKNPKAYDIRGVDTQPPELMNKRLFYTHKYVGEPKLQAMQGKKDGRYGYFEWNNDIKEVPKQGFIHINKNIDDVEFEKTFAHELGHAYDRNIKSNYISDGNYLFGKIGNNPLKLRNEVIKITKKIYPYTCENNKSYKKRKDERDYRQSNEEIFADWFGTLLINKNKIKKGKSFYNIFKNQEKDFIKGLKEVDKKVTSKYIKTPSKVKSKGKNSKNNRNTTKKK
ncbi:hypothetical protein [Methanococcus voltae]|uniref:Uncharacterized protein n=1 Tax=Methanococcus voltae (strain ATCC BAA-1334 / A3) TaxID=456320 RepID=D7DSN3_METV3|nr:hypothetical protein [Methanococcus voltae]MCS3901743.1 hypothetical protein [Methanococcus voltae]